MARVFIDKRPRKVSSADCKLMAAEYNAGHTIRCIAEKYGMSFGGVHHRLQQENVRFRAKGVPVGRKEKCLGAHLITESKLEEAA